MTREEILLNKEILKKAQEQAAKENLRKEAHKNRRTVAVATTDP